MPQSLHPRRRSLPTILALSIVFAAASVPAPAAATQCLQAVFFDLGNTLINQSLPSPWPLFATAQTAIDALQAAGIEVGVITNVPTQVPPFSRADLEALLQQPEFLDEFDVVLLSSLTDPLVSKPTPGIYTQAHALLPAPLPPI